jgi:hypothetical protein
VLSGCIVFKTPGTPRFKNVHPNDQMEQIDPDKHRKYRSGVRMLLYFIKHSRPDISNIVRELSISMDSTTMGTCLEMLRVIKFVLDNKNLCLKMNPKIENKN